MRTFNGKVLVRMPSTLHQELAQEAFDSGRSINQLCMEALLARKALKRYEPWRAIEQLWEEQKAVDPDKLAKDIRAAITEVRRER